MINPFELFGLEESFRVPADLLRTAYIKAIKTHHPDKFLHDSVAHEQALKQSSLIHEAYEILSSNMNATAYLLRKKGVLDDKEVLPNDFLFEMMDLNERLDEIEMAHNSEMAKELESELRGWEHELEETLTDSIQLYEAGVVQKLDQIKDSYLKMKYILRLKDRLINFASR